jgi:2-haloacid dehalogenase
MAHDIKVLFFDVFGTVVDWRSGIIRALARFGEAKGIAADWAAVADAWHGLYRPAMDAVRSGRRPWANLDVLHRESLVSILPRFGIEDLPETDIDALMLAWRRLDPWPDSVDGLARLKSRFIIATLSNGSVAILVHMAKHAGLPWDAVLGAETARAYKPDPAAYLANAALLGAAPGEAMLVAAHNYDLAAAQALGFKTAFIARPAEHGPGQTKDLKPEGDWDMAADSLTALAERLGC